MNMVYAYVRVSTDEQSVENQRHEINRFCAAKGIKINFWIEETASGASSIEQRKFGDALLIMKKDDLLICSELSRIGRNLLMIMSVLNLCLNKGICVWTIRDNFKLGSDLVSKVLAFAFSLSAEIERDLISQRTKEALSKKRLEGVVLGRPKGRKNSINKLDQYCHRIEELYKNSNSMASIARELGVHRSTVSRYIQMRSKDI